jgi:hypothetical protein
MKSVAVAIAAAVVAGVCGADDVRRPPFARPLLFPDAPPANSSSGYASPKSLLATADAGPEPGVERGKSEASPLLPQAQPVMSPNPPATSPTGPATATTPGWPQKVLLYEEDLNDPTGKRFAGFVVWRIDGIPSGPNQPDVAVRADIEIPEQKMSVRWSLRRNDETELPVTHVIDIAFTLPPDFAHRGISNVPGVLMKERETTRGVPLNGVAAKVTTNFFLIGLSSVDADMQRNIQHLKEWSWISVPIVYSDGRRAIMAVEKGTAGERAFADAFDRWREPVSKAQLPPSGNGEIGKSGFRWRDFASPERAARPTPKTDAIAQLTSTTPDGATLRPWPTPPRPSWAWPPSTRPSWVWAPGSPTSSWIWQQGPSLEAAKTIGLASRAIAPPMTPWLKPPPWLQSASKTMTMAMSTPSWPRLPAPDFRIPTGRSRFADEKDLEPPTQFVRWSDRLEEVLPGDREVDRRCRALGAESAPGKVIRGCSHQVAGRCFVIRVDDPGAARHELAHCNGWRHE